MSTPAQLLPRGPLHAEQLRSGDPYELSNGHAILVLPTGRRGSCPYSIGSRPDAPSRAAVSTARLGRGAQLEAWLTAAAGGSGAGALLGD